MTISIIVVTFNSAATLRTTFDGILRQDYGECEVIVVDGMSTDGTEGIIREYEPLFGGRMKWVSEPDGGIYDAMNKGLDMAMGDVVGFLNSDDFFTGDDALRTIAEAFNANAQVDAVYGDVHYVRRDDTTRVVRYYSSKVFSRRLMRFGFMPAHTTFYCRRELWEKYDITYRVAADFELLLRMIYVREIRTKYIPKDFVTMRTGGASSSGAASHIQINRDHLRALEANGVRSNIFLLSLRYLYKLSEFIRRGNI